MKLHCNGNNGRRVYIGLRSLRSLSTRLMHLKKI